jgi:AraC family transcriptional regulator, arabinose operon regulatory protein
MDNLGNLFIKNYLSNMQVNTTLAGYTHCWNKWRDLDYIPDYNKFYFIYSGEGWLKIDGRDYYPKPGQLFLMPKGVIQSYGTINENTFVKHWCHFTACIGDLNLFDIIHTPCFIDVENITYLSGLFDQLEKNYSDNTLTSMLKAKSALYGILSYFIEHSAVEKVQTYDLPHTEKLNSILTYIDNHISDEITVEDLARVAYLHPNYFIRFFKKHIGNSPIHYINSVRLEKAKSLLAGTSLPIKEIAVITGFNDLFYFSKSIKAYTGFSPSEFRRSQHS